MARKWYSIEWRMAPPALLVRRNRVVRFGGCRRRTTCWTPRAALTVTMFHVKGGHLLGIVRDCPRLMQLSPRKSPMHTFLSSVHLSSSLCVSFLRSPKSCVIATASPVSAVINMIVWAMSVWAKTFERCTIRACVFLSNVTLSTNAFERELLFLLIKTLIIRILLYIPIGIE